MSAAPTVLKDGINTPKPVHSADRPKLNKQPTTPVGKWSGGGRSRSEQKKLNMNSAHRRVRSKSASRTTDDVKCNIQVSLRVRPFLEEKRSEEGQNEVLRIEGNKVEITANQKKNCFEFTNVLDVNSTQEDVYNKVAMPLLSHALRGINVCVFAYGQTGSGKTYSIIGDHNNPGLLQRFCEDLLDAIREVNVEERRLTVSFYEIYQEKAYDLLGDVREALRVRGGDEAYLSGLIEVDVNNFEEFELLRQRAWTKRATASTTLNRQSSRSHAIVSLLYKRTVNEKAGNESKSFAITSRIHFVDLAGSERLHTTGYSHLEETISINASLSSLHRVIFSAVDGVQCGFRDSVLTRLLKDCLVGNARTTMLATVSPSAEFANETLSTLRFATQAASVALKPKVNIDPFLELVNSLKTENEELKERLAAVEALSSHATIFICPEAPCVIELQRDPALTTWTPLVNELAFSPCGIVDMVVGFKLDRNGKSATVEAYGSGVYVNGKALDESRCQSLENADRIVVRDERFFLILLDKSDETTILRDHSFSSVRLEYVESNFERVRAQVAVDKKADVQRERQQLLGEIDEEMKLRRKELEQSQQRITISHETPQRTEESEKVHELEVELDNLQTLSASFSITSNRLVEEITFEVESVDRKEQLMALQSEVDRANFILCRFQKENIYNFKLRTIDGNGEWLPCVRLTDRRLKMYGDMSADEFASVSEKIIEMNLSCTLVTEKEKQMMGEMLFRMCREMSNLVKMNSGRPSTIMRTAIFNSTSEAARMRQTSVAEFRQSLLGSKRSTISNRLLALRRTEEDEGEDKENDGEREYEKQFIRSMQGSVINRTERRESRKEGYGLMSVVLDILSDIRNLMPTLRSIDKRVIKGMPFFTSTCALAQSLAQLDQIVSILSSSRITSSDAEFRVTEVANELIHLSKVFESWLSHFEDEEDDEIRRLILDSAHRMFPRIVTAVGEASFWLDESFSQRNLSQEDKESIAMGIGRAIEEISEENCASYSRFPKISSSVAQTISAISEALTEACSLYKETPDERISFGIVKPLITMLRSSGRFNADSVRQNLTQILDRSMKVSLKQPQKLTSFLQKALQICPKN